MLKKTILIFWLCVLSGLAIFLSGCGGASGAQVNGDPLSAVSVSITPQTVALHTTGTQTFTATVNNSGMTTVTWLVNGISGGNSSLGTIDKTGNYTAPPYLPIPPNVTVTAVANADETKSANASVALSGPAVPGSVTIAPVSDTVYVGGTALFTATVNASNEAVTWQVNGVESGNDAVGTISQIAGTNQATYTAPLQVPDSGQVTVAAVSVANPEQAAEAIVTVSARPAGGPVVTITNPLVAPTVQAGETQQFQAGVTGTSNTAVSWQVDAIPGGNSSVGTIVAGSNDSATYTAPRALPDPPSVTVTAVSEAATYSEASLLVNLIPVQSVTVTVSADQCANTNAVTTGSSLQFSAAVTGNSNQSVTWQVNQVDGGNSQVGTISTSGSYTAPANVPNPATVTVSAVSNAVPSVSGSQKITITTQPVLQVLLAPVPAVPPAPYPEIETGNGQEFQATVIGAGNSSQAEITWLVNGYSDGDGGIYGSITANPLEGCVTTADYSAPATVPSPAQFPITAQSTYNSADSASLNVTIIPAPVITVTVDPSSANVPQTTQQVFNAQVSGSSDLNAYWSLSSSQCSGAACGTLSTAGPSTSTTYTAPTTGTPAVTLKAVAEASSSAQGTAAITVTCGGPASISIFPTSATIAAGSASPLSFSAIINPCGNQTVEVNWQLGCISLYDGDSGENCFDPNPDGGGPGCTQINGGFKVCGDRANVGPGTDPLDYYAPANLYTNAFAANVCEPANNGSGDGAVPLTATVTLQGCPQQGCQATACVTVTPP